MTVQELIRKLELMPSEAKVEVQECVGHYAADVTGLQLNDEQTVVTLEFS